MALQLIDGGAECREPSGDGDEANKTARLPRWTRQEILVLIQGKRVAESRPDRSAEPKWASISSYCKIHGVNRGPVQCRKRWSNLAGDFRKIKEWEARVRDDTESFWVMRNDLRRERKLPGFFDREVYDILDSDDGGGGGGGLALAVKVDEEEAVAALFDSGRSAAVDDALFSDFEDSGRAKECPDIQYPSVAQETPAGQGTKHAKEPGPEDEVQNARVERKRKRSANEGDDETANLEHQLIEALEKNGKLLSSQLEAQNTNLQLDREQRNDHVKGLITVINKLADALGRIADKL
ncbi:hypothetical protein PHJA_002261800 [Phtheirospermum japonicum]|uniref:Myb-like domain-containing protein n=1 Tax=Phtheirospermum japonicum TaxID=374723 RepID=A0A830CU66_9LAMI|nr:hypothetical protein PHJA_002261800 [Phtheirospermum japonicum]